MTSPSAAIDAIFNRPRDAAALLFLIEDSKPLASLWQHVRDAYLPTLLNAIQAANPTAAAETLWMTTSQLAPFNPSSNRSGRRPPHWNDIPFVSFSPHAETTISPINVTSAIEELSATFGRGPATRHLVVVATVNPSTDVLGTRKNLAWSAVVEQLYREEIRLHLIVRSQTEMDGLTPLYWDLIGKGQAYQSFTDDNKFAFYLYDFHDATGKGKASVVDTGRVPNSGSQSTTSASSIDKPSLVYQLQKMNGMEKKRRSRTRRDQPSADRPGQPYQKSNLHTRTTSSTTQPASPDPSSRSPSRRKDTSRAETSPSYFDTFPPATSSDEHRSPYSSVTSPSRSSSPSSPYYLDAGTSSSSPGPRSISPLRASLPIPTPTFDHFQHMALASQSAPDSFPSMSPGYHEFHNYSHELPGELRAHHSVSQAIPVDGSHLAAQYSDIYGSNRSCWNDYSRQQGRIELSAYPRSLESHPGGVLAPRLAHRPEQTSATSSFPLTSHGLDAPPTGNPGGGYFYPGYEDRVAGTPVQNTHFLANRSPDAESPTTVPYYP
ncbi:hypothetical protein BJ322DRAFT_1018687 [Thelephora terrestris]|uniref:Uncharacterized protein n=1 Tax=Thelephora terrestris TaxID=56493 RepID=A0A9P6HK58_9AGAM|nr:hypothetical protein BJ322DRAFT_1018687 [Thelephora terrestris]